MRVGSTLGRVLDKGSAKHGVGHWWAQRVTAIALVPLTAWFVTSLLFVPRFDYVTLAQWVSHGWNAVLLVVLVVVVAHHSYLGLRVVVEDYVRAAGARIVTLLVLQFAHVFFAAIGVFAILRVAFGNTPFGGSV